MKIWVKLILGEKILKDYTYTTLTFNPYDLQTYLEFICNELDEPTPIILNKHYNHMTEFNNTTFRQTDFVEEIFFDKMVVEVFDENEKNKNKKTSRFDCL